MSEHAETPGFSDEEFDSIQSAVLETDRGRLFLSEYSHRVRAADTEVLLDAIRRLEDNMVRLKAGPQEVQDDLADLADAISTTSDDILTVRNDMLDDKCAIEPGADVFASLTADAGNIAKALISTAEALQASAASLKETAVNTEQAAAIDANVNTLFENGWRQDVLTQRVAKAMGLLTHLQNSLSIYAPEQPNTPACDPAAETSFTEENRSYFAADAELFEDEEEDNGTDTAKVAAGTAAVVAANVFADAEPAHSEETLVFTETVEVQESEPDAQSPADEATGAIDEADAHATDARATDTQTDARPSDTIVADEDETNGEPAQTAFVGQPDEPGTDATAVNEDKADTAVEDAGPAAAEAETSAVEPRVVVIRGHTGTSETDEPASPVTAEQIAEDKTSEPASTNSSANDRLDPFAPADPAEPKASAEELQNTEITIEETAADDTGVDETTSPPDETNTGPARQNFGIAERAIGDEAINTDQEETPGSDNATVLDAPAEDSETLSAQEQSASDETSDVMEAFSDFAETTPVTDFSLAEAPQPEMTPTDEEKERIVIIRKDSSEDTSIPFADYLGIDEPTSDTSETTDKD